MRPTGVALALSIAMLPLLSAQTQRPAFGAIRWDAWMQGATVTRAVEKTLSPEKYHFRVPFFGVKTPEGGVSFPPYTQTTFDQELLYAKRGGVDFFAYCTYPTNDRMSMGLNYHKASKHRDLVKACLLMHQRLVPDWAAEIPLLIGWMKEPHYHKTPDGRPIIFTFESPLQKVKGRVEELSKAAQAAGLKRPYLAWMGWNPVSDFLAVKETGFDAHSAYARIASGQERFIDHAAGIRNAYWEAGASVGLEMVPFVGAGWDRRCRDENPVPWDKGKTPMANADANPFVRPTAAELAAHVKSALDWAAENRDLVPSQSIILYAWNEHDEGGWLCPTWSPAPVGPGRTNTDRIDALAEMFRTYKAPAAIPRARAAKVESVPTDGLVLWLDPSNPEGVKDGVPNDLSGKKIPVSVGGGARLVRFTGGKAAWRLGEAGRVGGYLEAASVETDEAVTVFVVAQRATAGGDPQARLASAYIANNADWKAPSWCIPLGKELDAFLPRVNMTSLTGVRTRGLRLGQEMHTGNSKFAGDLAEVLVYGRKLSGPELLFVKDYLEKKWVAGGAWVEVSK